MIGDGPHFWAAPYEEDAEFGGLGLPATRHAGDAAPRLEGRPAPGTTIALVATDALLTKAQAKRLAVAAHGGLAQALRFAHAPLDGDTVFAAATGARPDARSGARRSSRSRAVAADCLARAIARGVYEATALPFPGALPAWADRFGGSWSRERSRAGGSEPVRPVGLRIDDGFCAGDHLGDQPSRDRAERQAVMGVAEGEPEALVAAAPGR